MEDPIKFNVSGKLIPEHRAAALLAIRSCGTYRNEIELRVALNNAIRDGKRIAIVCALTWSAAHNLLMTRFHYPKQQ